MNSVSTGEWMLFIGITGSVVSLILMILTRVFSVRKERKLRKKLFDEYFE